MLLFLLKMGVFSGSDSLSGFYFSSCGTEAALRLQTGPSSSSSSSSSLSWPSCDLTGFCWGRWGHVRAALLGVSGDSVRMEMDSSSLADQMKTVFVGREIEALKMTVLPRKRSPRWIHCLRGHFHIQIIQFQDAVILFKV